MCLYPRIIRNPRYKANKKNGGVIPQAKDKRALYVAIGCGKCMECRKQKANEWRVRLNEEIKRNNNPCRFVTLTIREEYLKSIEETAGKDNVYGQATILVRRYLERIRKRTGKSVKHWIIPELGHKGTERLHLHGLIWCEEPWILKEEWAKVCGHYFGGKDITAKTINYVSKYILKQDEKHSEFQGKIFCSAGIGQGYVGSLQYSKNEYKGSQTDETYRLPTGHRVALPIYYRNKRWTDSEREQLWMARLDRQIRYVDSLAVDMAIEEDRYWRLLETAREKNERLHYGKLDGWEKARYINSCKKIASSVWKNKNNIVTLQNDNNKNTTYYGNEKTTRNPYADELLAIRGQEKNNGDDIFPTGRLYTGKGVWIREVENERLGNATSGCLTNDGQRSTGIIPGDTKRLPATSNMLKTINHEQRTRRTTDIDPTQTIQGNVKASTRNGCAEQREREIVGEDNRSRYECIDIDSGEIFHKPEYGKTYKTISYEKRCQKITRPDGSKSKIWHTIRFVQEIGYEQLNLFSDSDRML